MSLTLTLERGGGEVSGSGTNIELDGTIAGGAIESVEMYGDTEQTTYSGKNLVYTRQRTDSGLTWTYDSITGIGNVKGTAGLTYSVASSIPVDIPSGTFTASIQQAISNVTIGVGYRVDGGSRATIPIYANTTSSTKTFGGTKITTLDVYLTGLTVGTYYDITYKIQFESGSTATSFEPYVGGTASPNPDYPQEVQAVTGRQVVTISDDDNQSQEYEINLGKNLFDKDNVNTGALYVNGPTMELASSAGLVSIWIPCSGGETYTIQKLNNGTNQRFRVWTTAESPAVGVSVLSVNATDGTYDNDASYTVTTPSSARYLGVLISVSSTTPSVSDIEDSIQLEKGSTATTYAPYFTPIELCKIGDYQDYIYKSGEDWYVHKETSKYTFDGSESVSYSANGGFTISSTNVATYFVGIKEAPLEGYSDKFVVETRTNTWTGEGKIGLSASNVFWLKWADVGSTAQACKDWLAANAPNLYYALAIPTDTQITNEALIAQLEVLNAGETYEGATVITVSSENLAGSLEVTVATNIAKTYTEVEIGSPFTIADVEGKSSNTTLDGNVYVDWAYNKKQYSFDLFNLTPQDYADIRAYYDYQFSNSAFPTITVPELNIDRLPVYMEISSRNIINQCLLTDKLTIKFRETVQP